VDFPSQDTWFDPAATLSGEDFAGADWRNAAGEELQADLALTDAPDQPETAAGNAGDPATDANVTRVDETRGVTPLSDESQDVYPSYGDLPPEPGPCAPTDMDLEQGPADAPDGEDTGEPAGDAPGADQPDYAEEDSEILYLAEAAGDIPDEQLEDAQDRDAERELISPLEAGLELATSGTWDRVDPQEVAALQDEECEPGEPAPPGEPEPGYSQADLELLAAIERMEAGQAPADEEADDVSTVQARDLDDVPEPEAAAEASPESPASQTPQEKLLRRAGPSTLSEVQEELRALARLFESGPDRSDRDDPAESAQAQREMAREPLSHILRKRPSRRTRLLTLLASLALLATLAVQLVHYRRDSLLHHPAWGPRVGQVYASLGVELPEQWELDKYDVRQLGGIQDPGDPGTLLIGISLRNRATRDQPFPVIRLVLEDRWGQQLGKLDISPAEYLPDPDQAGRPMRAGETLRTDLGIVDPPGGGATNFQIDVCLPRRDGQLDCANRL